MTARKSPWSYRPGSPRDDRILAYAQEHGIEKSEAMHRLIDIGLGVPQEPKAAPPPAPAKAAAAQRWRV